jgi:hypothetical protein
MAFKEQTGTANPFNGIDVGSRSAPTFADIDEDGDLDAVVGEWDGFLNYYPHSAPQTVTEGNYVEKNQRENQNKHIK